LNPNNTLSFLLRIKQPIKTQILQYLLGLVIVLFLRNRGNVAKHKAEKAVILVQDSLILGQVLNNIRIFKWIIGDLPKELVLS